MAALAISCAEMYPQNPLWLLVMLGCTLPILIIRPATSLFWIYIGAGFFTLHQLNHWQNPGRQLALKLGSAPQTVRAVGIVIEEPVENKGAHGSSQSRFKVQLERIDFSNPDIENLGSLPLERTEPCHAKVLLKWTGAVPAYGDRVEFVGTANPIPGPRNPGQMDWAGYLERLEIYTEIWVRYSSDGSIISHDHGNCWIIWAEKSRRWMQSKLVMDLQDSPEIAGLIQSLVLGLKDQTPEETRNLFRNTGTIHLFVVNGLHIGMFALITQLLLRPIGITRRYSVFFVIPLLIFYTLATGLNPGSIRATLMASILLFGRFFDRLAISFNSLAAAAFIILTWNTQQLFMPGFQFSFGVVFSILLFAGRFHHFFSRFGRPDLFLPRTLWSPVQEIGFFCSQHTSRLLGLSLAAWIGSIPFTLNYFHLLSPSAAVANLIVVPIAFIILSQGILSMLTAISSNWVAILFNNANWAVTQLLLRIVHFFALIPGGHIYISPLKYHPPKCSITVFDFDRGDCIYLRSNNQDWLLDTGPSSLYENTLRPFLQMHGINHLNGLILTGRGSRSLGGATRILFEFKPRSVIDSPLLDHSATHAAFINALSNLDQGKGIYEAGDSLKISGETSLRVLYPPGGLNVRVLDDKSMVLQIITSEFRVLIMSNAGFLTERWLLDQEIDLKSDILIKNRHPSDLSGTTDFIDAVQPQVIITASAGFTANPENTKTWLKNISLRGIQLFQQDSTGAVRIEIYRDRYSVEGFLENQIFLKKSR